MEYRLVPSVCSYCGTGCGVLFEVMDGKVMINDANITATDVMASNGVIHIIDTVVMPKM